jgi:hypothetical protein
MLFGSAVALVTFLSGAVSALYVDFALNNPQALANIHSVVSNHAQQHVKRQSTKWLDSYEYVIVGAGAGGGPLASRLAIAGFKVLLIDAGGDVGDDDQVRVPALSLIATEYLPQQWDYFVSHYSDEARQEKDSKMTYKTPSGNYHVGPGAPPGSKPLGILYPRAGTLGGSTAHNALITVYPHDSDWNNIASLTGDKSWSAANMRNYFKKLERNRYLPSSILGHGYDGWLGTALTSLSLVAEDLKVLSLIVAASTAMGRGILGGLINTVAGLGQVVGNFPAFLPTCGSRIIILLFLKAFETRGVEFCPVLTCANFAFSSCCAISMHLARLLRKVSIKSHCL